MMKFSLLLDEKRQVLAVQLVEEIKNRKVTKVKKLVDEGADIHAIDQKSKSVLAHAFQMVIDDKGQQASSLKILKHLLKSIEPMSQDMIRSWIRRAKRFWHDDSCNKKILLDILTNHLLGNDIRTYYTEDNLRKYAAAILSLKGESVEQDIQKTPINVAGMDPYVYLALKVRALLDVLFKRDEIEPAISELCYNELHYTLQTALVYKLNQRINALASVMPIQSHGHIFKQLRVLLAEQVIRQLEKLQDTEDYGLCIGWRQHAMYLVITRDKECLRPRLDNLGAGIQKHPCEIKKYFGREVRYAPPAQFEQAIPLHITAPKKEDREKKGDQERPTMIIPEPIKSNLLDYLVQLLDISDDIRITDIRHQEMSDDKYLDIIYREAKELIAQKLKGSGMITVTPLKFELQREQLSGNCFHYGWRIRLVNRYAQSSKPFIDFVDTAEFAFCQIIASHKLDKEDAKGIPLLKNIFPYLPPYLIRTTIDHFKKPRGLSILADEDKSLHLPDLQDIYIEPDMVESTVSLHRSDLLLGQQQLMRIERLSKEQWFNRELPGAMRILLEGEAGIGKSAFCWYFTIHEALWSTRFDMALLLPLRFLDKAVKEGKKTLLEIIADTTLCFPQPLRRVDKELLGMAIHEKRILFLLDGADELPTEKSADLEAVYQEIINYEYYIMTSRPYGVPKNIPFNLRLRMRGFNKVAALEYVNKFFSVVSNEEKQKVKPAEKAEEAKEGKKSGEAKTIVAEIQKNPAWDNISRSPLLLEFCCILQQQGSGLLLSEMTMTALYQRILKQLAWQFVKKDHPNARVEPQNIDKHYVGKALIEVLEELATRGKGSGHSNIEQETLDRAFRALKLERDVNGDLLNFIFLKPTAEDVNGIVSTVYFAHATFQDFCVAQRLAKQCQIKKKPLPKKAKEFIAVNRYQISYRLIWPFVAGLLSIGQANRGLKKIFDALTAAPQDCGSYQTPVLLSCLEECFASPSGSQSLVTVNLTEVLESYLSDASPEIPTILLQTLSLCPRLLASVDLLPKLDAMLGVKLEVKAQSAELEKEEEAVTDVKAAIYIVELGHHTVVHRAWYIIEMLVTYLMSPLSAEKIIWQERALRTLLQALHTVPSDLLEKFMQQSSKLLWTLAEEARTLSTRQLAVALLIKAVKSDRIDSLIKTLVTSSSNKDKRRQLLLLQPLFPVIPGEKLLLCQATIKGMVKELKGGHKNPCRIAYAIGRYSSLSFAPEAKELNAFRIMKIHSIADAVLVSATFPGSSKAQEAAVYIESQDMTRITQKELQWVLQTIIDHLKRFTGDSDFVLSVDIIRQIILNAPDQLLYLPTHYWQENFPKDWKESLEDSNFIKKLPIFPTEVIFLISQSTEHTNRNLLGILLDSIYQNGLPFILNDSDREIILYGSTQQYRYILLAENFQWLQEEINQRPKLKISIRTVAVADDSRRQDRDEDEDKSRRMEKDQSNRDKDSGAPGPSSGQSSSFLSLPGDPGKKPIEAVSQSRYSLLSGEPYFNRAQRAQIELLQYIFMQDDPKSAAKLEEKRQFLQQQDAFKNLLPKIDALYAKQAMQYSSEQEAIQAAMLESLSSENSRKESKKQTSLTFSQELKLEAKVWGLTCYDVARSGNCLFESIDDQLQRRHPQLRTDRNIHSYDDLRVLACVHLITHKEDYKDFMTEDWDKFVAKMVQDRTWGEHLMAQAVSDMLKCTIVILYSHHTSPTILTPKNAVEVTPILVIGYELKPEKFSGGIRYVGVHYQSICGDLVKLTTSLSLGALPDMKQKNKP